MLINNNNTNFVGFHVTCPNVGSLQILFQRK